MRQRSESNVRCFSRQLGEGFVFQEEEEEEEVVPCIEEYFLCSLCAAFSRFTFPFLWLSPSPRPSPSPSPICHSSF